MREDFVTQLRLQLREAAERDARRGRVRRLAHSLRWDAARPASVVAAGLVAVAALALVVLPYLRADQPAPAGRDLQVVAHGDLVSRGGGLTVAGGAVWASDLDTGEILRIDPRSRAVQARVQAGVQAGGDLPISAGGGALWAAARGRLLRIDPADARITGRVRVGEPDAGFPVAGAGVMWLIDALELRRVDTERLAFDHTVRVNRGSFMANGVASDGDVIYVQTGEGTITGYDAATGDQVRSVRVRRPAHLAQAASGALVLIADDRVEVVDPRIDATRWLRPLGTFSVNAAVVQGSSVWVQGSDATRARDLLWRLDLGDGRVLGKLTLPDFGVTAMAPVGDALWLVSDGGQLTVVRPG